MSDAGPHLTWVRSRSGIVLALGALLTLLAAAPATATKHPERLVEPFMGTEAGAPDFGTGGGAGNTYPGATAPFGMLNWSPDTDPSWVNFAGGYTYSDTRIKGFSLTHISGAGCSGYQDFPFIPTTVPVTAAPTRKGSSDLDPELLASFDHGHEAARPGSYSVTLDPDDPRRRIEVDLAAETRSGVGAFSYPRGEQANLLINAASNGMANPLTSVRVRPGKQEVSGTTETGSFCWARPYFPVHFVARFNRRFERFGTWRNQTLRPGSTYARDTAANPFNLKPLEGLPNPGTASTTAQAGAYVGFGHGGAVRVRVGISFTSTADARRNLKAEVGGSGVREVARRTSARWRRALAKVDIDGGGRRNRRTFYTSLYHALLEPRTISDVDGSYPAMGGGGIDRTPRAAYADFSGWDVYRTQIPLLGMLFPGRAADIADSILEFADGNGCLPKWSFGPGHTMVMTGDPAAQALASLDAMGVDIDRERAIGAMLKGAERNCRVTDPDYVQRPGGAEFRERGWIGYEREAQFGRDTSKFGSPLGLWGPAATTLEYASADSAIARMAARQCRRSVYARMTERSGFWRNLFDRSSGRIVPRLRAGDFMPVAAGSRDGFVEGSSNQYTFMVPHDPAGLAQALGGREAAVERLDHLFTELNAGQDSPYAFLGNEPNLNAPWLYDWWGRPDRTQAVVRAALLELYSPTPGGFPGNDDLGTMSSWFVLAALGIYPQIPGEDVLALTSPLFPRASIRFGGRAVVIATRGNGRYIRSAEVAGGAHETPWIHFAALRRARKIRFDLAKRPRPWGSAKRLAPPSYGPDAVLRGC